MDYIDLLLGCVIACCLHAIWLLLFGDSNGTIEFACPRCGKAARFSPDTGGAFCSFDGQLVYTEIPPEVAKHRKSRWAR